MYKTLCSAVASSGFIVVAVEHEDGSALFAETAAHEQVPNVGPPQGFKYTRDNVVEFRGPYLAKRLEEMKRVISALQSQGNGVMPEQNSTLVSQILEHADPSKMHLMGHSFGAATTVKVEQELPEVEFLSSIILDLWSYPVPEEQVTQGVSCPSIFINSQPFCVNKEFEVTQRLFENSAAALGFGMPGSVHQSFSDTPLLIPQVLGRKIGFSGTASVDQVYQTLNDAIVGFLRSVDGKQRGDALELKDLQDQILADPGIKQFKQMSSL
eukprot:TRINITY_DN2834_c0_g1_i3.p1 TRINITY_DN2834_c0_g1~~TRINITY_DN2834_c0_g1_i3.p1  ORF type:complete len:268 (-),score=64.36 TRINITY_DN2834_c0_g1_i3:199-1002(-)